MESCKLYRKFLILNVRLNELYLGIMVSLPALFICRSVNCHILNSFLVCFFIFQTSVNGCVDNTNDARSTNQWHAEITVTVGANRRSSTVRNQRFVRIARARSMFAIGWPKMRVACIFFTGELALFLFLFDQSSITLFGGFCWSSPQNCALNNVNWRLNNDKNIHQREKWARYWQMLAK